MEKYICIHGHFYQPPRENPWLEEVEMQDSARPFHDWNERITAECYAPNASSRILGNREQILDIVSNYERMSFNVGPTLLSWLEQHSPEIYQSILESDRRSQARYAGHGSALAQVYNHMIMPLANTRDKETQILWGLRDFEHRFQRQPEGMWLSETAVDLETLDLLAQHGIKFTILASHQAGRVRRIRDAKWKDVSGGRVDPRVPYRCILPSKRSIILFFYDNPMAHDVAFGGLLNNGEVFAQRLMSAFTEEADDPGQAAQLVHIATDGETYGHHHRYGDMALAYCFRTLESQPSVKLTNYGEFLHKFAVLHEAEIVENTSWSCFHGVERWRSHCGCNIGRIPGGSQAWRGPLRDAMDHIRDELAPRFQQVLGALLADPWAARNDYIRVILDRSETVREGFFQQHSLRPLTAPERSQAIQLLEMMRHAMLMYTSCGWFFDELSGIETLQVMQYAARALQLAQEALGVSLESGVLAHLREALSNLPEFFNGEQVWKEYIQPASITIEKVCGHYAASSLFETYPKDFRLYCYTIRQTEYIREIRGEKKLALGRVLIRSEITREERDMSFAVLHHADYDVAGGMRPVTEGDPWREQQAEMVRAFSLGDVDTALKMVNRHYPAPDYSLWLLYKDEQMKVLYFLLESSLRESDHYFRGLYQRHYPLVQVMNKMHIPLPKVLATTVEYVLNADMAELLEEPDLDFGRLWTLGNEMRKWSFKRDKGPLGMKASRKILETMEKFQASPLDLALLSAANQLLEIFNSLPIELDLWKAQNVYYHIDRVHYAARWALKEEDAVAKEWLELFDQLGRSLRVPR